MCLAPFHDFESDKMKWKTNGLLMTTYPGATLKPSWRIAQMTMQSVVSCIVSKFMTNNVTVLISFLNFRSCAKYWYDSRFLWHFKDIQIYVKTDIYLDFCYTWFNQVVFIHWTLDELCSKFKCKPKMLLWVGIYYCM